MTKCLDKGFVRLVDKMGTDSSIVQAARVSTGLGLKTPEEDKKLIRYLMENFHSSPFEMVEFKFHVKCPIFVARQWHRHRTASINEISGRYSVMQDEFYLPDENDINEQSTNNKQGRKDEQFIGSSVVRNEMEDLMIQNFESYKTHVGENVAREVARIQLPLSTYTEFYWKIDLHNLFHFLKLRLDKHAQKEIRVYAEAILEIVKENVPIAFEAFRDFVLKAITLTDKDISILLSNLNFDKSNKDLIRITGKISDQRERYDI